MTPRFLTCQRKRQCIEGRPHLVKKDDRLGLDWLEHNLVLCMTRKEAHYLVDLFRIQNNLFHSQEYLSVPYTESQKSLPDLYRDWRMGLGYSVIATQFSGLVVPEVFIMVKTMQFRFYGRLQWKKYNAVIWVSEAKLCYLQRRIKHLLKDGFFCATEAKQ